MTPNHMNFNNMHLTPQSRSASIEGAQSALAEQSQQTSIAGSYGQYAMQQEQQTGAYQNMQSDPGWTQRVLEEMKDLLLLLNAQGRITYASPSCKSVTGRAAKQLEGSLFTQYIHEDDKGIFLRDMDDAVAMNQPFRTHVRLHKSNNSYSLVEAFGHPHIANENNDAGRRNSTSQDRCTGFFIMCRPYPTKNSLLLDSFLEHKIENARLVQQIAKLRQEEDEEASMSRLSYNKIDDKMVDVQSAAQGSGSDQESVETVAPNSDESDDVQGDYFSENAPRTGGLSHIEGIEVMTGLYYGDGERSRGLSTGARRGRLIQCDIDITTAADQARNVQEGDRRKRLKGQHVCTDCGTADSPEWRKGPSGPKTLCNACGLRWSKKEKKRQEST
ncbi:GATA transcription factor LreB-like protein [Penicillium ucsense]|uniref:GATA transcription factor LreB-like protein n=1 Tax=Penicillium ucsense TaxID=2839758 RepID=A0A8J8W410_9EURO|nr:GATA transcription factor LreB-like protein [Penicillium ucsense]KAF7734541.1 GATA transcription factor LreB-like protein [Penicillium ucsense]